MGWLREEAQLLLWPKWPEPTPDETTAKKKENRAKPIGYWAQVACLSTAQLFLAQQTSPSHQRGGKKKKRGRGLSDQAHATSPLPGQARKPASLLSETTASARHRRKEGLL